MRSRAALILFVFACHPRPNMATQPTVPELVMGAVRGADKQRWTPPSLRLGNSVQPTRYVARLKIVPSEETFSGRLDIELVIKEPTSIIWLNGSELVVTEAKLTDSEKTISADPVPGGEDFLGFALEVPVKSGPATLHLTYTGKLSKRDSRGLFREKEEDHWYAFSQFESVYARLAFPCFDEPSFKVPWQLTVEVRAEDRAFSNTPITSDRETGNGFRVIQFAETKPLPSYLIAFGVGPFDVVEAGFAGQQRTPVRILTLKGRGSEARYAAQISSEIFARIEAYLDVPYPFEKLDLLTIPLTSEFGAMENAGLITAAQTLLIAKPEDEGVQFRRRWASTFAHELAHMWFGDLVTTAWWDDIWLNEALATWMETRVIDAWKPEWHHHTGPVRNRAVAMKTDSLTSARRIRQPIVSRHDIANAFDSLTYLKGATVLAMFERWVGEEKFRQGIHTYLQRYAFKSATASDFLSAISDEAGQEIGPPFSSFLDQAGIPAIGLSPRCDRGTKPKVLLSQDRYLPMGAPAMAKQTWQVPLCVRFGTGPRESSACTLIAQPSVELELNSAGSCPSWLLSNDGALGYYRSVYDQDSLTRLLSRGLQQLSTAERFGLLDDLNGLFHVGKISGDNFLGYLPLFAKDPSREVASAAAALVYDLPEALVPTNQRARYAKYVQKLFAERAKRLGWNPRAKEGDDAPLERAVLLPLVADRGQDQKLQQEADRLAQRWLADRRALQPEIIESVLWTAARIGSPALFDQLLAQARKATDRRDRARLLGALGYFTDRDLAKSASSLVLSDAFDPRESMVVLWHQSQHSETRGMAYDFVKQNFDALVERLPRDAGASLPFVGSGFCDEEHETDMREFFAGRSTNFHGGPRNLSLALESVHLCTALREAQPFSPSAWERVGGSGK